MGPNIKMYIRGIIMNKYLLISLLSFLASFGVNSSDVKEEFDTEEFDTSDWVQVDADKGESEDYSPETFIQRSLDNNNQERNALSGTIELGTKRYRVRLFNRRDFTSQALSNLGASQKSHYSLTEVLERVTGLAKTGETLRGRLQTSIDEDLKAYKMVFYKGVVDRYDYTQEITPDNALYTVYIPLKEIKQVDGNFRPKIALRIPRTLSKNPEVDVAAFFSTDGTEEINLDLEFEDSDLIAELSKAAVNAASATASYLMKAWGRAWDCVAKDGLMCTLGKVVEFAETANRVTSGLTNASEALKQKGLLANAQNVVKNGKEVEGFIKDVHVLTEFTDQAINMPNAVNLEGQINEAEAAIVAAQEAWNKAEQTRLTLETQIANYKSRSGKFEKLVPGLTTKLEDAKNNLDIKDATLKIAKLKRELFDAAPEARMKIIAEIETQKDIISILSSPDEE